MTNNCAYCLPRTDGCQADRPDVYKLGGISAKRFCKKLLLIGIAVASITYTGCSSSSPSGQLPVSSASSLSIATSADESNQSANSLNSTPVQSQASSSATSSSSSQPSSNAASKPAASTSSAASSSKSSSVPSSSSSQSSSKTSSSSKASSPGAYVPKEPVVGASFYSKIEDRIFELVNEERESLSLKPLKKDNNLKMSADIRTMEMFETEQFSHTRPDGTNCTTACAEVGFYDDIAYFAENIYYSSFESTAQRMFDTWKNSPSHYAAMISTNYDYIGISVYGNQDKMYGAQHFGRYFS